MSRDGQGSMRVKSQNGPKRQGPPPKGPSWDGQHSGEKIIRRGVARGNNRRQPSTHGEPRAHVIGDVRAAEHRLIGLLTDGRYRDRGFAVRDLKRPEDFAAVVAQFANAAVNYIDNQDGRLGKTYRVVKATLREAIVNLCARGRINHVKLRGGRTIKFVVPRAALAA